MSDQIFSEPEVQRPDSHPRALSRYIAVQSDESDDTVVDLVPPDTLLPAPTRPGSPPPVLVLKKLSRLLENFRCL